MSLTAILRAIRKNCLECCCQMRDEVKECEMECSLKPYRFGTDPKSRKNNKKKVS